MEANNVHSDAPDLPFSQITGSTVLSFCLPLLLLCVQDPTRWMEWNLKRMQCDHVTYSS